MLCLHTSILLNDINFCWNNINDTSFTSVTSEIFEANTFVNQNLILIIFKQKDPYKNRRSTTLIFRGVEPSLKVVYKDGN